MKKSTKEREKLNLEEFQSLLKIDRHNLDEEIERQPDLYYSVAREAVFYRSRLDRLESEKDRVYASLDTLIRQKAEKDDSKITENAIKARIRQDKTYRNLVDQGFILKKRLDELTVLQEAFRQRSYMLRDLVELFTTGYFTDAAIKGDEGRAKDKKAERNKDRMTQRRRERI